MAVDVMLWNKEKTESVRASKIRSFGIYKEAIYSVDTKGYIDRIKLLGWYDENNHFYFGLWDTEDEARAFLEGLHKQIEGR